MEAPIISADMGALLSSMGSVGAAIMLGWLVVAFRFPSLRPSCTLMSIANGTLLVTAGFVLLQHGAPGSGVYFQLGFFLALYLYACAVCELVDIPSPPGLKLLVIGVTALAVITTASAEATNLLATETILFAAALTLYIAAKAKHSAALSSNVAKILSAPEMVLAALLYVKMLSVLLINEAQVNQTVYAVYGIWSAIGFTLLLNASVVVVAMVRHHHSLHERYLRDELTGLANGSAAHQILSQLWNAHQASPQNFSILLIDIDHFSRINRCYGEDAGTNAVRRIARILSQNLRTNDVAARLKGEKFVVILPKTPIAAAEKVADKLCQQFAESRWDFSLSPVTASIGCADTRLASSADRMLTLAQGALYQAKFTGRNRVVSVTIEDNALATSTSY